MQQTKLLRHSTVSRRSDLLVWRDSASRAAHALRAREERPSVSDASKRPWPSSQEAVASQVNDFAAFDLFRYDNEAGYSMRTAELARMVATRFLK